MGLQMNEFASAAFAPDAMLPDLLAWRALPGEAARDLLCGATSIDLARNQDVGVGVGVVLAGALGVRRDLSDGRKVLTTLFQEGEIVDRRREARVCQGELIALGPSTFLAFDGASFDACAQDCRALSDLASAQLRELAARMCDHVADLACKTPVERIASALFEFRRWPDPTPDLATSAFPSSARISPIISGFSRRPSAGRSASWRKRV
jgi:hypothetical protein